MVAGTGPVTARLPVVTLAVCLTALALLGLPPSLQDLLQFDRPRIANGEVWRLVTCHAVHYAPEHAARDVAGFAVLGALLERESRAVMLSALAVAVIAVAFVLWVVEPDLGVYRGLSALVFTLLGTYCAVAPGRGSHPPTMAVVVLVAALLWIGVQWVSIGDPGIAGSTAYVPVASAHLAGLCVGVAAALLQGAQTRRASCRG